MNTTFIVEITKNGNRRIGFLAEEVSRPNTAWLEMNYNTLPPKDTKFFKFFPLTGGSMCISGFEILRIVRQATEQDVIDSYTMKDYGSARNPSTYAIQELTGFIIPEENV